MVKGDCQPGGAVDRSQLQLCQTALTGLEDDRDSARYWVLQLCWRRVNPVSAATPVIFDQFQIDLSQKERQKLSAVQLVA